PLRLVSSLPRRPPTSPLFPYPTLFRSVRRRVRGVEVAARALGLEVEAVVAAGGVRRGHDAARRHRLAHERARRARALDLRDRHQDRKSTRLNSSHVKISYAVFCLKIKT